MALNSSNEQYPVFKSAFLAMRVWLHSWNPARQNARSLDDCDSNEIDRIAQDLGLSRDELRQMARLRPDAAKLLLKRLEKLHLDAKNLAMTEPAVMRDLQRLCSLCVSKGQCQRDFARGGEDPSWRDYCPNENTLIALQQGAGIDD
jgi:hypothetical protein